MGFLIIGIVFFVAGILFIFFPKVVSQLDKWSEKILFSVKGTIKHHRVTGIFFVAVAVLMVIFELLMRR